ncbi:MAG: PEPxxWA-CTERM sorting domain-containing protein, partial [Sphingomonadaceae bacterium]
EIRGQFRVVPEPASWAMMIAGFGLIGAALRRYRPGRTIVRFG